MATPVISVDDIVVSEADTIAFLTVNLSESSATTVTVAFPLSEVTTLDNSNYVATSGIRSFPPQKLRV